jgi:hypothetical protein
MSSAIPHQALGVCLVELPANVARRERKTCSTGAIAVVIVTPCLYRAREHRYNVNMQSARQDGTCTEENTTFIATRRASS